MMLRNQEGSRGNDETRSRHHSHPGFAGDTEFFLTVFDLEEGERPLAIQRIPGHWLYSEGHPLVHIIRSQGSGFDRSAEAIDHVGFRMEGYTEFRNKLDQLGIRYSVTDLADIGERRLFFRAPGGPLLEAVFSEPVPQNDRIPIGLTTL